MTDTAAGRRCRPFTLIELLAVIGIIAILAGIVLGGVGVANRKAAEAKTKSVIAQLESALSSYQQEFGYYPISAADYKISDVLVKGSPLNSTTPRLHGLEKRTAGGASRSYFITSMEALSFSGGFLSDPFGGNVYYRCPGTMNPQSFDLWSAGPDGKFGASGTATATDAESPAGVNSDDVTNWKR